MSYQITLRALPGNWRTSPDQRLRAALKTLLRAYGLRCEDIRETDHHNTAPVQSDFCARQVNDPNPPPDAASHGTRNDGVSPGLSVAGDQSKSLKSNPGAKC